MGREIRRVPKNWEHPKKEDGSYQPMYDESYESALTEWLEGHKLWETGEHPDKKKYESARECKYYAQWAGTSPDPEYYRPEWDEEPTCYQIYETVSEGTPFSPVFENKEDMVKWLIGQGYHKDAAKNFAESGWAPSMVLNAPKNKNEKGFLLSDIHSCILQK